MFRQEEYPLVPDSRFLAETFEQRPVKIPLSLPLAPSPIIVMRERSNALPIIAIVSIVGLIGLFAFLAYMGRGR